MKRQSVLRDIKNFFISIPKGLWVTLVHWSPARESVTELYPEKKPELPENYRGIPTLPVDPKTGRTKCIACSACAKICPEQIITVEMDKSDPKDRKPAKFEIDISRCMWCGLCMEVCPKDCLKPGKDFELACDQRVCMIYGLEDLQRLGGELPPEPEPEEDQTDSKGE